MTDKLTDKEVNDLVDKAWMRLSQKEPLTEAESIKLRNLLSLIKGRYLPSE
jgi:hypothetical protein